MEVVRLMKFEDFLKNSAVFITLITAFFYCCSAIYIDGFLRVLGLDSDVLERSFHSIVFHGFTLVIDIWLYAVLSLAVFYWVRAVIGIEVNKYFLNRARLKRVLKYKRKLYLSLNIRTRKLNYFERPYLFAFFKAFLVFLFCFCLVFILARYQVLGKERAYAVQNQLKEEMAERNTSESKAQQLQPSKIVSSLKAELNGPLYLLYCGSRMCAGFDLESEEIVYFPQSGYRVKGGIASSQ